MSTITIKAFAEQIGIDPERLVKQLGDAGVAGKTVEDSLQDDEKRQLLEFLRGGPATSAPTGRGKITLKKKTTSEIQQTSKTGIARTVQVQTKRRRTFVKREVLEQEEAERQATEQARLDQEKANAEQARLEAEAAAKLAAEDEKRKEAEKAEAEAKAAAEKEAEERVQKEKAERESKSKVEAQAKAAEDSVKTQPVKQEPAKEEQSKEPTKSIEKADVPAAEKPADKQPQAEEKPARPRREVAMPSIIRKAGDRKRVSPIIKQADPKPAPAPKAAEPKSTKSKGKRKPFTGREELHVSTSGRRRQKGKRRPSNIKSSVSDQHAFERPVAPVVRDVQIGETISVADLAAQMSVKAAEVVKTLFKMGTMVTINHTLDQDTAMLVVDEMGHNAVEARQTDLEVFLSESMEVETNESDYAPRCPVVTVMGHVDHGKTSLLDYIRKARVTDGEAGGITQHIGAYQVETSNGQITFLDTPGHEAFSAMRARGAQATDLIILVVAADDGVKPQTIEAIKHAKSAEVPIIVAINKMDKESADPDRVKQELANEDVIPESWGGDVMMVPVSAHSGDGIEELLESIAVQAELLELKARPSGNATGLVVEARLDKGRGAVCTVLVQQGILKYGDVVLVGQETGRIRAMNDDTGKPIKEAGPSTPVEIQGLSGVPAAGDEMVVVVDERKAREAAEFRQQKDREARLARQQAAKLENMFSQMSEGDVKNVNVLIKGDVQGSIEALTESLIKLSTDEVKVSVVHGMVGGINESDVNLAMASSAVIIGFNVRADAQARKLAEQEDVQIRYYSIIYEVIDDVKAAMEGLLEPEIREDIMGYVEVREVFRAPKIGTIAGCYVTEGVVKRKAHVRVLRDSVVIFEGNIDSLRRFKDDVSEVKMGTECGIGIVNYNDIKEGDQLEIFEKTEVKVTL
ncbi:translation initiation factor IF-2 [Arenicella chitinivorans]|uniref:Translation initiation factor IF-2 n=1 Tax=Arenicella chitinivorans TaxID=1329800 RepID=A0A918RRI9_9GAMM|nr:translation initiation factor IF-2 [Arenicella chitinivorans]GHA08470.1 translation initiation factor IF-2 [Arenicella chitinivorans]